VKPLGKPIHIAHSGLLILRTKAVPKIGAVVVDENSKPIGTVFDVFGPVNNPFVAIKPHQKLSPKDLPNTLFVVPRKPKKATRKKAKSRANRSKRKQLKQ